MNKLFVIKALLLGSVVCSYAADDLSSAFKNGKWDGRIRLQYFLTDWDDNSATGKNGKDASGFAIGGSILYKTAPYYGFTIGGGLYTTQNAFNLTDPEDGVTATTSKDLFSRDPGSKYGDGFTTLAQLYLGYDFARIKTKTGRFLTTNPWITPNDTKMIPIAVEGIEIVSNDLPNTTIQFDYTQKIKERGKSYFDGMASTGDTPAKILNYYVGKENPNLYIFGVKNRSINNLELQGWIMHWDELVNQATIEGNYAIEAGDAIIGFSGRYIQQFDIGAGNIILPQTNNNDNNNKIDGSLWALKTTINLGNSRFLLATSQTSSDADIIAPWRGFPTYGYTRSKTQTDWNAGTTSYKAEFDYDWDEYIEGLSTILSYSKYDRDENKIPYQSMTNRGYGNGDTKQWNLDIIQKLSGDFKNIELKARLMNQDNSPTTLYPKETSNREMRLEANYRF
ncbi:MAG: OprD family outer membrane porin [Sulfurovaceae bacterium]|nr:OprD family outer membrane porin [Sulfurovaceae bacterium]MDD5548416.1 OprD family outer membrane porin [Sulfurovaceae bacterium]